MKKTIVLAALLLAGCNPAYKAPDTPDVAKLRFYVPEARGSVGVYAFDDDQCSAGKKLRQIGGIQMGGMSSSQLDIGMWKFSNLSYESNNYVEVPVAAGQRFNFALHGANVGVCNLTMSFLPRAQAQYEVSYVTQGGHCFARIDELVLEGNGLARKAEPTAAKNPRACTFFWN